MILGLMADDYDGLGMDALVTVCLGTQTELWLGHGCSADCMLLERERVKCRKTWDSNPRAR